MSTNKIIIMMTTIRIMMFDAFEGDSNDKNSDDDDEGGHKELV